jgi:uncharacterized membrane protein YgdD (TMEM256/DUF423 family)
MTASARIPLAGPALIAAPVLLTAADAMQLTGRFDFAWTVVMWAAFVCFVPAVFALAAMARQGAPGLAVAGGVLALVGAMAGAAMQALFRAIAVLQGAAIDPGARDAALRALNESAPLTVTTLVPGIFFPLGLLVLAIALHRARVVPAWSTGLLALGAVLFPVGHAAGFAPAIIAGDLAILGALAPLVPWLLRGDGSPAASPTVRAA